MPASRTRSGRPVSVKRAADQDDIIVLSSDDDDLPLRQIDKSPSKKPFSDPDIVEIASDDPGPSQSNYKIQAMEVKLRKVSQENDKLKQRQLELTKQLADSNQTHSAVDPTELDENLCCPICTLKLWSPFTLPECGHTFCQSCLEDWFNTSLAHHKAAHPHYNLNQAQILPPYFHTLIAPLQLTPQQRTEIASIIGARGPQPTYTCPSCREPVLHRPVEVYALKNVVRSVAKAQGEDSPKKQTTFKGKSRRATRVSNPWDKFSFK